MLPGIELSQNEKAKVPGVEDAMSNPELLPRRAAYYIASWLLA
jgi:hypothetical protein